MIDRPAIRAEEGIPSRPGEHLTLREPRASSHQAGVMEVRERVDCGGGFKVGGDGREREQVGDTARK